mmetsp:Transcript_17856/g.39573  ORF Transcript_17856/g.39573 Transcript_17856/m.39573 type:complete len:779 (+) Transcript_17856:3-2339(+)
MEDRDYFPDFAGAPQARLDHPWHPGRREGQTCSTSPQQKPSLDFSMITTPGGERSARVLLDEDRPFKTPTAANTATAVSNGVLDGLRGIMASTPNFGATPYTTARESCHDDCTVDCTALSFARSAPISGYLRKMGKNITQFKRRFFVLKPSTHLYYFLSSSDNEPRGCIDVDMLTNEGREGCEVKEIGLMPDGTFQFELVFDEERVEKESMNDSLLDEEMTSHESSEAPRRTFHRQSIILEARTEELGRQWMDLLQTERLSTAKSEVNYLRSTVNDMTAISKRWEASACEEAMRADSSEHQRNSAIAESKEWERRFTDLNEAILSLVSNSGQSGTSSEFLEEAWKDLNVENTNFEVLSKHFQNVLNDFKRLKDGVESATMRMKEYQSRVEEAESRATDAEALFTRLKDDNGTLQNELAKLKRERKILVKEVKSLHAKASNDKNQRECDDKQPRSASSSQVTSSDVSYTRPSRRLNSEEKRLVIELEKHVMSGLRLSEQFLTLNGIDPAEVEDDLDDNAQSISSACAQKTDSERAKPSSDYLGSLLDDHDDESGTEDLLIPTAQPSDDKGKVCENLDSKFSKSGHQLDGHRRRDEASTERNNSVSKNLNDRFKEYEDSHSQDIKARNEEMSVQRGPPSLHSASSVSESLRSKVTDNGSPTSKLECTLRDVGETPQSTRGGSSLGDDGKVYHITFYSNKIGLQFQKVPNHSKTGLLSDAMGADYGAREGTEDLRRIVSLSRQTRRVEQECLPAIPKDAVLVCGFVGFDDSTGNVRPRLGG